MRCSNILHLLLIFTVHASSTASASASASSRAAQAVVLPRHHPLSKTTNTRNRTVIHGLRGGAGDASAPSAASSKFWSTNAQSQPKRFNPRPSQPSSFSSPRFQSSGSDVKVTDVTNEVKESDREETKEAIDSFLTRDNRNTFIARVYAILSVQLMTVAVSILAFARNPSWGLWMLNRRAVPMASLLLSTICVTVMSFSTSARRSAPLKWQLLTLFTVGEAIAIGFITSFYKTKTVMSAMTSTAIATLSVSMYTFMNNKPKYDLSQWGSGLASMGIIFIFYGIIRSLSAFGILPQNFLPYNETLYCLFGTGLFTMYLAYHTRLIVAGKHSKYQLSDKDYVFGAVLLYNDIINIFLYLLRLFGDADD